MSNIRIIELPTGRTIPQLGQGTWRLGENDSKRQQEILALRTGLDLGMTLIDTAEYYRDSEPLIAEALGDRRKEVFLVSKVLPHNATRKGTVEACERTLRRLQTDYLDLYLLHWPGSVPLQETLEAFQLLKRNGKILDYGVSNFDISLMEQTVHLAGGSEIATNQILYNLARRGIEWDLLPWSQKHEMPLMAYSPFEEGRLLSNPKLRKLAVQYSATPAQIALAWVLAKGLIAIPKAGCVEHVIENSKAAGLNLTEADLKELDSFFPPPSTKIPLEMI